MPNAFGIKSLSDLTPWVQAPMVGEQGYTFPNSWCPPGQWHLSTTSWFSVWVSLPWLEQVSLERQPTTYLRPRVAGVGETLLENQPKLSQLGPWESGDLTQCPVTGWYVGEEGGCPGQAKGGMVAASPG